MPRWLVIVVYDAKRIARRDLVAVSWLNAIRMGAALSAQSAMGSGWRCIAAIRVHPLDTPDAVWKQWWRDHGGEIRNVAGKVSKS